MAKNYYLILGLASDASDQEIRSAYKRLAKELHPDISGKDSVPFLELQEAYSVLNDPEKRQQYDDCRGKRQTNPRVPIEPLVRNRINVEPLIPRKWSDNPGYSIRDEFQTFIPSFDELFDYLGQNFRSLTHRKTEHVKSITIDVPVTSMQAFKGGQVQIRVPVRFECNVCQGMGNIGSFECLRCSGQGKLVGEYPVSVRFPGGIRDRYTMDVSLTNLGIRNAYLSVRFCIDDTF